MYTDNKYSVIVNEGNFRTFKNVSSFRINCFKKLTGLVNVTFFKLAYPLSAQYL